MTNTTVSLYAYSYREAKTYLIAALFVLGNIAMPQLFHLMPKGGMIWLPIYFFTLVGAYKYGWRVGLLTAIASPIINSALFSMPQPAVVSCHINKVGVTGHSSRLCCQQVSKGKHCIAHGRRCLLSVFWQFSRMGAYGQCRSRFARCSPCYTRNNSSDIGWLYFH